MKLKVNKIALSIATAVLMVTSILSTVSSAAATNEITLSASKTSAKAGDKINVSVGYIPNSTGVAGFTINLHYDADKVEVYLPSEAEKDSTYNVNSKFSVITNYAVSSGVVKIVGANLMNTNIKAATNLALATFTVKSDAQGDIKFWVEVDTMISSGSGGYTNASYTAPNSKSPLTVSGPKVTTSATTTTKATTTAATTTKATTTTAATTTKATTTAETTTNQAETTAKTTTPDETPEPVATTTKAQTTAVTTTTRPVSEVSDEEEALPVEEIETEAIFVHQQGDFDFNSEEALGYSFSLSDYIEDFSQNYDLNILISTSGSVNGGIGMLVDGSWQSAANQTAGSADDTWTIENIDPDTASDEIFVQLYYLSANSHFRINSIEFTPVASANSENQNKEIDESSESKDPVLDVSESDEETYYSADANRSDADNDDNGEASPVSDSSDNDSELDSSEAVAQDTTETSEPSDSSLENDSSNVEETVKNAAQAADSNPSTGNSSETVRNIIIFLCLAEIGWSLFVVIYNKFAGKSKG